jgi:glutaryl-CoA dehydrogenase
LNLDLTDEQLAIQETVREFVDRRIMPVAQENDINHHLDMGIIEGMAELGLLGPVIPTEYGGSGLDYVSEALICEEIERGESAFRTLISVHVGLNSLSLYRFGTEEQKQRYLVPMAKGEKLGCFGLTEPGFGSNPGGMTTVARKSGDEYILNGEKMWITSGNIADVAVIWAKVEDEDHKVRGFLVETDRPGFRAYEVHGKWSLRASVTSGLSLQDVHVPASNLLPGTGGLKSPLMCLNQARYGISWGAIGAAMSCYDTALQYAKARKQFHNQPIASHQLIQDKLVWMVTEISKAQLLSLQVGRLKDAGTVGHQHISMAKRNNVWMALECARISRDILGANGITEDYPIMRHMMNLESVKTYEGTHDIHALIIGQHITGSGAY